MRTILIIDDHSEMRENISELLELEGYKVVSASNGSDGLLMAQISSPDLILCDIKMGDVNGYQVLTILKQSNKTKKIPFVFMTAFSENQAKLTGINMGASAYLVKPFTEEALMCTVKETLHNEFDKIKNMLFSFINSRFSSPYMQQAFFN